MDAIEKVLIWRGLYNGAYGVKRLYMDHAARLLGIKKKTLDDYLLQLR